MTRGRRLLVVGLDAADRGLVLDLVGRGRLPHIGALLDGGTRADVDTPYGTFVGSVWPTFSTGQRASRHGRYCYEQLSPGTYDIHRTGPVSGFFWTAAARAGRRVATVDVPHSDLVAGAPGVQVVDWGHHDPNVGFRTAPEGLGASIIERYGRQPGDACDGYSRRSALGELRADLIDGIGRKAAFAADLVASEEWDLFVVVFGESHCIGHQAWAVHDPTHVRHDPVVAAALGDPVEDTYVALDLALGRLLGEVGEDMAVMLVLSHGMTAHYDANFLLPEMLRLMEQADGPSSLATGLRRQVGRVIRKIRRTVSSSESFVRSVDGTRPYFAIPNNDAYGAIRLNLIGREPRGRVAAGEEFETVCDRLRTGLHAWVNRETGEPLVRRVVAAGDHYPGARTGSLPDLFVEWNRSAVIRSIEAPGVGRIDREYGGVRSGDHRPGGLVVTRGPGIAADVTHPAVRTEDLAPTICAAIGVDLVEADGVVRPGLLAGAEAVR